MHSRPIGCEHACKAGSPSYQTNSNPSRHSAPDSAGLTLELLSILRYSHMRRTALIATVLGLALLTALHATPASAARSQRGAASASRPHRQAHAGAAHAVRHPAARAQTRFRHRRRGSSAARPRRSSRPNLEQDAPAQSPVAQHASLHTSRAANSSTLRGSYESLVRQNQKSEADSLERIEDDADLADRIARKMLVPVPASSLLTVNGNLPENRRYCRPWTANFLDDLARSHATRYHRPLEVSSAVRTVDYQRRLMGTNGNAAQAEGDIVSPHLTGATIDIAKSGMSRDELGWMRSHLLPLQQAGKIDVEEEFRQACFHITVYKSYTAAHPALDAAQPKALPPARQTLPAPVPPAPETSPAIASRGR